MSYMPNDLQQPRLRWEETPNILWSQSNQFARVAKAGPLTCTVLDYNDGEFEWYTEAGTAHHMGRANSLLEAQLAAESAAQACLREGLAAFGPPAPPIPDPKLDELDRLASGAEAGDSMQIAGSVYPMLALMLEKCTPTTIRTLVAAARELEWVKAVNAALLPYQERAVNAESQLNQLLTKLGADEIPANELEALLAAARDLERANVVEPISEF
jgi:hypothetical protein